MPYEVRPAPTGTGFQVINSDTDEVKSEHATKADADRQVRLLEGLEHGMKQDPEGGAP